MPMAISENRLDRLREEFEERRGYWAPFWEDILQLDTNFFEAFLNFSTVPWQSGTLAPKVKEFIYIAVDAATTHLFKPGIRIHVREALKHGATREEILEVLELVSVLGMHSITVGVPLLVQALEEAGHEDWNVPVQLGRRQDELKKRFEEERGYWSSVWEKLLILDTDYFAAYLELSTIPWRNGPLDPKVKELIYIAVDASSTHLFEPGLRLHLKQALAYGASSQEILEVLELVSIIGIHSCVVAVPMLAEELRNLKKESSGRAPQ